MVFAATGRVVAAGAAMAVQRGGAVLGARMALRRGAGLVRVVLVVVLR
jgi:hypothetical protein